MAAIEVQAVGTTARVEAVPGDRVTVRLPENPTAGYVWTLADGPQPVDSAFEPAAGGAAGAAGDRIFTLAVDSSPATLTFTLARPWAPADAERTFTLTLVRPGGTRD